MSEDSNKYKGEFNAVNSDGVKITGKIVFIADAPEKPIAPITKPIVESF